MPPNAEEGGGGPAVRHRGGGPAKLGVGEVPATPQNLNFLEVWVFPPGVPLLGCASLLTL